MSIQTKKYTSKKTGKTTITYYAAVFDTIAQKYVWSAGCKTEREAKIKESEMILQSKKQKKSLVKQKILFSTIAEEWFTSSESQYSKGTYKTYDSYYKRYLEPYWGTQNITEIKRKNVQGFINELSQRLSPATVNKSKSILSLIFQYAIDIHELDMDNPCDKVKSAKVKKPFHQTWTPEEVRYFINLDSVKESVYYEMLVLIALTGARPEEICGVSINALVGGCLLMDRGYDRDGNITDMKTTNSHRNLELPEPLWELLMKRKEHTSQILHETGETHDFLFCREDGSLINPNVLSKNFKKLLLANNKEASELKIQYGYIPEGKYQLPEICLYELRHSFATTLVLDECIPDKAVAEVLGNSVKTLLYHYSHCRKGVQGQTLKSYSQMVYSS